MSHTRITKRIETHLYLCSVVTHSSNRVPLTFCQECYSSNRTNKRYRSIEIVSKSTSPVRCHRCNACTPAYIIKEFGVTAKELQDAIQKGESIDISENNIELFLT